MPDDIKEQIDDMLKIDEPTVTEAPYTDSIITKSPITELPETTSPVTEISSTEAPVTEAPVDDELEETKKENEKLHQQLNKLYEKETLKTTAPSTEPPFDEIDFLGEEIDPNDLVNDPDVLNKLFNKVYKTGIEASRKFQENTLKNIPEIVKTSVVMHAVLEKKINEFYVDNKDLQPFKKAVATVYEELASENPDWDVDKTFNEVEKETRKRLELKKKSEVDETSTTSTFKGPKFPKTKASRKQQKPSTNSLLDEIDKMNIPY